ncbi:isochorismatase family protein [Pontiella sulfatireligans]|uniref:Isochorismatase n=1 Tax=Pontiella sulfatireligans TaxID=2750658 RepID=A0A6C2URC5_9BACT|nr:isochorismatase family protein [Pontiella sulfatireligans]VGO22880.1 Isochorismatase [Pontiella sulfatireligans]
MLKRDEAVLVFIDVQGRLHEIMDGKEALDANLEKLIRCAQLLEVPILATEQIPEKLGPTNEPFKSMLADEVAVSKSSFSCCGEPKFMEQLERLGRRQFILVGIETHVCVYQTAIDLVEFGSEVFIAADAVASRSPENKALALQALRGAGAKALPTETLLFALLRDAADPRFKELLKLIK